MKQQIGKLDRRIVVQIATETRDAYGGSVTTWGSYVTRWANISYTRKAGESFEAGEKTSIYTVLFTVRSDSGTRTMNTKMRIVYESDVYDIRAISERADHYRKMYLTIEAENVGSEDAGVAAAFGDEAPPGSVWGWVE